MPTYEQNKKHIYKWREQNRENHNASNSKCQKKRILWKKECKLFLQILL
jgi:hypothetical protein